MRSSAAKRFDRRQLRQLSDLKEQIESATTSRFSSSMGLADSFPRLRPRPLDEKRSNSSRLGESTPETRLVQVRILLPQPATRTNFSPRASGWIFTRYFRQLSPVTRQSERRLARQFRGSGGLSGDFSPGPISALTQRDAASASISSNADPFRRRPADDWT